MTEKVVIVYMANGKYTNTKHQHKKKKKLIHPPCHDVLCSNEILFYSFGFGLDSSLLTRLCSDGKGNHGKGSVAINIPSEGGINET